MRCIHSKLALAACLIVGFPVLAAAAVVTPFAAGSHPLPVVHGNAVVRPLVSTGSVGPSWTKLKHSPSVSVGAMLLLTDGRVLVHEEPNCNPGPGCVGTDYTAWFVLTPDKYGSYVNGTWSPAASMPAAYGPLFFGSAVLPDGKVIVEGGEYLCPGGNCNPTWTNLGALYDPAADAWTAIAPPGSPTPWANIGDAQSIVLPYGYMQANCCGLLDGASTPLAARFNEATMSWTQVNEISKYDEFDEEGWTLLPHSQVLTVDAYVGCAPSHPKCAQSGNSGTHSELWVGGWRSAGSTIVQLWDSNCGKGGGSDEVGPAVLRPDGTVFYTGSSDCRAGHTAIYNSATGTWTAGPNFPNGDAANDAPASIEPNGNVIVMGSPYAGTFSTPSNFYEWNGSTLTRIVAPPNAVNDPSYNGHLLVLPNGQILFTDYTPDVEVFKPTGTYKSAWQPTVTSAPFIMMPGMTYTASGTQFNGLTQGAAYGDDFQDATNYPLVRIVNAFTGHVYYCKTHNFEGGVVATGTRTVSTQFDLPAGIESGPARMYVVANGIPSRPVGVYIL